MPTISPFGLDGNNHTKSLSPFDIQCKGWTKIFSPLIYILLSILPLSTCWNLWLSSLFVHAKMYQSVHAPPWAHAESAKIFFKRITWLYNSTKWVWPSYHQWLIHTSISKLSVDTPLWLIHPTRWGYTKCLYMTENRNYYIILPMHSGVQIRSLQDL